MLFVFVFILPESIFSRSMLHRSCVCNSIVVWHIWRLKFDDLFLLNKLILCHNEWSLDFDWSILTYQHALIGLILSSLVLSVLLRLDLASPISPSALNRFCLPLKETSPQHDAATTFPTRRMVSEQNFGFWFI